MDWDDLKVFLALTHKDLRLSAGTRVLREVIATELAKVRHQLDSRL